MEPVDHWRTALATFSDVVARVGDDQWESPTMCPDWNARELVDHAAWWQRTTVGQLGLGPAAETPLGEISNGSLARIAGDLQHWLVKPAATEGYRTAEVTLGGVDTNELSSQTMEAHKQPGLFFIGEVVDVTGHLGGFNFQWAWSSGHAAGLAV